MRVVWLATTLALSQAQFQLFSRPSYEDGYNMVSDVVGMQDALGAWGRIFRNMANRNRPNVLESLRQYTVAPSHVDVESVRSLPKGNGEIINEKLLNLLLPRIKGQPAFTTSTQSTTTPSTTTAAPTTESTTTETTTPEPTTTKKVETTTTKKIITTKKPETTTTQKPTESTTEELTTLSPPKGSNENGGPQFTVVFRTGNKDLLESKKAGVEIVETDFNGDKEPEITTTELQEDTTTLPKKSTSKTEELKEKDAEMETTKASPVMEKEEIMMKNALKQKDLDDDEVISTTRVVEETTEATIESSGEQPSDATTFLTEEVTTTTINTITKKATETSKKVEKKSVEKSNAKKEETKKTDKKETVKKADDNKKTPLEKKEDKKVSSSAELEAQIEKEASEILELLNKPSIDKREELSRRLLLDKLRVYLEKHETSTTRLSELLSTTPLPKTTTTISEEPSSTTTKQQVAEKEESSTTSIPRAETSTTAFKTEETTTEEVEEKKTFSVKKSLRIPEAEEEELKPSFVQEDVPADITTTTTVSTTTLQRASSVAPGSTVYNLNANANSDTHPQLANVITPIAGILDGISPILVPLLGSSGQVARARARGIQTYVPTGRDIMSESPGETSLVGFGTQLARELLSPGILKRERQARERAMAAKIEEARRMRESKSLIATILDVAQTGPPLQLPMIATPKPQVQRELEPLPIASSNGEASLYVPQPPPGYQGPSPPLPPPPPPGFIPRGYNGPIPVKFALPVASNTPSPTPGQALRIDGVGDHTMNTPYFPPELKTTTSFPNDEGFQMGRSGVRTTFREDSGVPLEGNGISMGEMLVNPDMPSISIAPVDNSGVVLPPGPSEAGGGFGGGRKPSGSFEEASGNTKMDNSFLISRKRM